jgi:hypothetical protein
MQLGVNVTICYPRQNQYDVAWSKSLGAPEKDRQRRQHRHTVLRHFNNTQFALIFLHLAVRKLFIAPHRARLHRKQRKVR